MPEKSKYAVIGDWKIRVSDGNFFIASFDPSKIREIRLKMPVTLDVAPAEIIDVKNEEYASLPIFNANTAGYAKGVRLRGVTAMEVTAPGYLDPNSVVVKSAPDGEVFTRGTDYEMDDVWATVGRLPNGKIGENSKVFISYKHGLGTPRFDSRKS